MAKIDEKGAIRELKSREILIAWLAICLLSNDGDDISILGDELSWFFRCWFFWGDMKKPVEMMIEYFEFK